MNTQKAQRILHYGLVRLVASCITVHLSEENMGRVQTEANHQSEENDIAVDALRACTQTQVDQRLKTTFRRHHKFYNPR